MSKRNLRQRIDPSKIKQELDMCEQGPMRGDEILHQHGADESNSQSEPLRLDQVLETFEVDLAEENREGDEMSGDEHSAGLQGGEPELEGQMHIDTGLPGDETEHSAELEERDSKRFKEL